MATDVKITTYLCRINIFDGIVPLKNDVKSTSQQPDRDKGRCVDSESYYPNNPDSPEKESETKKTELVVNNSDISTSTVLTYLLNEDDYDPRGMQLQAYLVDNWYVNSLALQYLCALSGSIVWRHVIDHFQAGLEIEVGNACGTSGRGRTICPCSWGETIVRRGNYEPDSLGGDWVTFHEPIIWTPTDYAGKIPAIDIDTGGVQQFGSSDIATSALEEINNKRTSWRGTSGVTLTELSSDNYLSALAYNMAYEYATGVQGNATLPETNITFTNQAYGRGRIPYDGTYQEIGVKLANDLTVSTYLGNLQKYIGIGHITRDNMLYYVVITATGYEDTNKEYVHGCIDTLYMSTLPGDDAKWINIQYGLVPGEAIVVWWSFMRSDGNLFSIPVSVANFKTHGLNGGYITEVIGEYGSVDLRYKVKIWGKEYQCRSSDFVEYAVGDWVYICRSTTAGTCGQGEKNLVEANLISGGSSDDEDYVGVDEEKPDGNYARKKGTFLGLINKYRKENNLSTLKFNETLNSIAQQQSEYQAKIMTMQHEGIGGKTFAQRMEESGLIYDNSGENVGNCLDQTCLNITANFEHYGQVVEVQDFSGDWTKMIFYGWKYSPSHDATMKGNFTHCGIGVAKDKNNELYVTLDCAKLLLDPKDSFIIIPLGKIDGIGA